MKDLIKAVDKLPDIIKIILCLPFLDIVWAVYRVLKGLAHKDTFTLVIGILWIVGACTFTWVWDLVTTVIYKHPKLA